MSDFFTRLAERTLGLAPLLQPIIVSIFATEAQQMGDEPFEAAIENETSTMMARQQSLTTSRQVQLPLSVIEEKMRPPVKRDLYHDAISTAPAHNIEESTPDTTSSTNPAPTVIERFSLLPMDIKSRSIATKESARPSSPAQSGGETQLVHQRTQVDHTTPSPAVGAQFVVPNLVTSNSIAPNPVTANSIAPNPVVSNEPAHPLSHIRTQREETTRPPQRVTNSPKTASMPVDSTSPVQHSVGTRFIAPETTPVASTTPTIQVTIGRIEVRATPPEASATPVQRQSSGPAVKSLDDYLRQRAKGGH